MSGRRIVEGHASCSYGAMGESSPLSMRRSLMQGFLFHKHLFRDLGVLSAATLARMRGENAARVKP
ncbi:MAG: hypothetical protein U9N12_06620 [Euryarchaeota archaeon]|nr:hypothetical protein [Euryarchaeota archaeon]